VDRDGTLNAEVGPIRDPQELRILPGVGQGLRALTKGDFQLVVITNQAAVGRGDLSAAELERIHARLRQLLRSEGIELAAIYVCPHLPEDDCDCRKPRPGLLVRAAQDLGIRLEESWIIGDSMRDIGAGNELGMPSVLVETGWGGSDPRAAELEGKYTPSTQVEDFESAAAWILRHEARPRVRKRR
jgi:histidinol-phosphate phosphatase family protein